MKKVLIGGLILIVVLNSCAKNSSSGTCNSAYDQCAAVAPKSEVDSVGRYLIANNLFDTSVKAHCSGLFYKIISPGTGKTPTICSTITVSYKGHLADSAKTSFDQSSSLAYTLGRFILGFKNGILQIKEGGSIDLYIPPSLAYGSQTMDKIPANSMLIFNVTLLSVQD